MAMLIYTSICSLDGYIEDAEGKFDWAAPSEQVHRFVNQLERPIGTYLLGRRMYETLVFWESPELLRDESPAMAEYAQIWQAADKVVYSTTLTEAQSAKTRIESGFDPDAIRRLKAEARADIGIGGAELAAQALSAGLVDEYRLFLNPVIVGAGKPSLPPGFGAQLHLLEEHRFENGVVYLRYALGR